MKLIITCLCLCLGLCVNAQLPSYVPSSGIIGYWPLDGNANDISGNGHNGINNGAIATANRNGTPNACLHFDIDYVEMLNLPLNLQSDFSFSYWQKLNSFLVPNVILDLNQNKVCNGTPHIWQWGDSVRFGMCSTDVGSLSLGGQSQLINNWVNFTFTHTGGVTKMYKNGTLIFTLNNTWPLTSTAQFTLANGGNTLGVLHGQPSNIFIDDVGMWNRVLSESEILGLYQAISVGVDQVTERKEVILYPNPSTETVTIKTPETFIGSTFSISDVTGRILKQGQLTSTISQINLTGLNAGIYLISFGREDNETLKIFKN